MNTVYGSRIQWYRCDNPGESNSALPLFGVEGWTDEVMFTDGKEVHIGLCHVIFMDSGEVKTEWWAGRGYEVDIYLGVTHWAHLPELPQV